MTHHCNHPPAEPQREGFHSHGHEGHGCHPHQGLSQHRLWAVFALTGLYFVAELIGGWWTGSLALLADAGHMSADLAAMGLALFALWLAQCPPPPQKTYGYHRMEVLAAFVNGMTLVLISVWILIEAIQRFQAPEPIIGMPMLYVALGGLLVNCFAVFWLHQHSHDNLNVRGVYLHILGDLLGSVGTIAAAAAILWLDWPWADPLISCVIACLILWSAVRLVLDAVNVLLEGSPDHINVTEVQQAMAETPGVVSVHDLHIWSITSGKVALSAHVVVVADQCRTTMLTTLHGMLHQRFGLHHTTLQLEPPDFQEPHLHF